MVDESIDGMRDALERARKERELYRKLLELGTVEALEPFLEEALALVVEVAGARRGYIELRRGAGDDARDDGAPFFLARGFSEDETREEVRKAISTGVIAAAIASGRTVVTVSAQTDPSFQNRKSVRQNRIEAVLCAPIGSPPLGVVYLQDRLETGPFTDDDRQRTEVFARHLVPYADRLMTREERRAAQDHTRALRGSLHVPRLVGRSAALARVLSDVKLFAPRSVSVLLTGETGTGKTDIARVLHDNSPRAKGPFVWLNCANLSEQLAESELFGHERGAFTSADRQSVGKVASASGGTLFLDEIGELPLPVQSKLLTFLETKEYYSVGSSKLSRADVRIVAATNVHLEAAVKERQFRQDLYHRLSGFTIRIPSLAERREDIPELMAHFLSRVCETESLPALRFSPGAMRAAEAAEWPGNIRELSRAVEAAAFRAAGDGAIEIDRHYLFPDGAGAPSGGGAGKPRMTLQAATRDFQAKLVQGVLDEVGWNVPEAAERLDIVRSHVYNLIKAFGLKKGRA